MVKYRKLHDIILIILLIGLLNIYDIIKNVNIVIFSIIYIYDKNILYIFIITLFFLLIFLNSPDSNSTQEFELILGLGLIGLYIILLAKDLVLFYLALELYSLSVYLLLYKNEKFQANLTILYFLLGGISSSMILLGVSIIYYFSGSLEIFYIFQNLDIVLNYHKNLIFIFGLTIFFFGILFKIGAAPFQFWVVRIYSNMEIKILTYQSIIPKFVYILFLSHLISLLPPGNNTYFFFKIFLISAFLSLFIGSMGGITSGVNKFKKIMAYSSIIHVGYLLIGVIANGTLLIQDSNILYLNIFQYLFIYSFNTFHFFLAFLLLQKFLNQNLVLNKPIFFLQLLFSIFSFIGLPPFAGFYGKLNILLNCYNTENKIFLIAILFIIFSTLIAAFLYLKFINFFYFSLNNFFSSTLSFSFFSFSYLFSFFSLFLLLYPLFLPFFSPFFDYLSL